MLNNQPATTWTCKGEGGCCGNFLPLSKGEINVIQRHVKAHPELQPYAGTGMDCPFLNADKKDRCRIYEIRPAVCRGFRCCDKGPSPELAKKMIAKKMAPVNMRETFFGAN